MEEVFQRLFDLSKRTQNKFKNFAGKFREAPNLNGIRLEKLNSKCGFRSARIDDNYRAILAQEGDAYFVMYVGDHEDAYRWADTHTANFNNYTETLQLRPTVIPTRPEPEAAIREASRPLGTYTSEQLLAIGVPEDLMERVQNYSSWEEAAEDTALPQDAHEYVCDLLDGTPYSAVLERVVEGKAQKGEAAELSANNRRFFVEISDEELERVMNGDMEKWQIYLHPTQRRLATMHTSGPTKVSGSAGTGKTVAALHRLKHLTERPGAKVLFTTFTRALRGNLQGLVEKMGVDKAHYELHNIDALLRKLAEDTGVINKQTCILDYGVSNGSRSRELWQSVLDEADATDAVVSADFLYEEYTDVILYHGLKSLAEYIGQRRVGRAGTLSRSKRAKIWRLVEEYEKRKRAINAVDRSELFNMVADHLNAAGLHPYTNVIADEFQDFSNPELRFLRSLTPEGPDDLFLTGDPFQRIYPSRKINFSRAGINVRGRSRKLKVNYRTTEEIKRQAVAVIKDVKYEDLDGGVEDTKGYMSITHGKKPEYRTFSSKAEECAAVVEYIRALRAEEVPYSEICVGAVRRELYKSIVDTLHREKIPYREIKDGKPVGNEKGVMFSTFHSMKGLEFDAVALVGVDEKHVPSVKASLRADRRERPDEECADELKRIRSLLYVALTRARMAALLTGQKPGTGLLN